MWIEEIHSLEVRIVALPRIPKCGTNSGTETSLPQNLYTQLYGCQFMMEGQYLPH
jgi:hypothetical protein